MSKPTGPCVEWLQLADETAVRRTALQRIFVAARAAQAERGVFHVALAGGSTPRQLYEDWRQLDDFDWRRTEIYWGDERAVSPDHPDSNFGMAHQALLRHVPIPSQHIHRMLAERADLEQAAQLYEDRLRQRLGADGRLDMLLLGLGTDAHTASLFPGSVALTENERWVVAASAPVIAPRLTGTPVWFNAARQVLFLVAGAKKRAAVSRVRGAAGAQPQIPATWIAPPGGTVTWLLDAEAAGLDTSLP